MKVVKAVSAVGAVRAVGLVRSAGVLTVLTFLTVPTVHAQDTVRVQPEARVDTTTRPMLPPEVLQELIRAWSDSGTTRIVGSFFLPSGARLSGPVAVLYGPLRVAGELMGRVTVINGNLIIDNGGLVRGEVLVVGGRVVQRQGSRYEPIRPRSFSAQAPLVRTPAGTLVVRSPPRTLANLAVDFLSQR